jgi:hypothetical protein
MGRRSRRSGLIGLETGLAACLGAMLWAPSALHAQPAAAERVVIAYEEPAKPVHKPLYDLLKENKALERVSELLVSLRWPRTLRLELKSCDDSNAWYEHAVITVCYEYLDDMWLAANSSKRPAFISREDAFLGPVVDTFLHEAGHAIFDLFKVPRLGREEDAADAIAAYYVLQFPNEKKRRLIAGSAFGYAAELKVRKARDLNRRRFEVGRHVTFADEHGTPAQRLYNLLCLAYGSDKQLFAEVVEKGFLPEQRAEMCEDEYRQVEHAFRTLIAPHLDAGKEPLARPLTTPAATKAPAKHRIRVHRKDRRAIARPRAAPVAKFPHGVPVQVR